MRILIPYPYYHEDSGGVPNVIANFSREAARMGHRVTIVTTRRADEPGQQLIDGVSIVRFPFRHALMFRRLRDYPRFGRLVRAALASGRLERPDVIYGISFGADAGIGGPLAYRSAAGPVRWEWDMWQELWRRGWCHANPLKRLAMRVDFLLQARLEARCTRSARCLVCHSKDIADGFRKEYGIAAPVHTPCTGVDVKRFLPGRKAAAKRELGITGPVLFFSGGFSIQKGAKVVEESLPFIVRRHPDVCVIIAGKPTHIMDLPADLAAHVRYLGHVRHALLPRHYAAADVFIFPTVQNEGFPNSVLEAMASGLPVVISRIPGIEEYIQHGRNGIVVPKYDAEAFAQAVCGLLDDKKRRASLGAAARQTSLDFAWPKVVRDILSFLSQTFNA